MTRSEQLDKELEEIYKRINDKLDLINSIYERMNADDKELHER